MTPHEGSAGAGEALNTEHALGSWLAAVLCVWFYCSAYFHEGCALRECRTRQRCSQEHKVKETSDRENHPLLISFSWNQCKISPVLACELVDKLNMNFKLMTSL